MLFNQYKFSPADVSEWAVSSATSLASSHPEVNAAQFAARVISERLSDKPIGYLEYGPYWWAVKFAMGHLGYSLGQTDDGVVRAEYAGDLVPYAALVAGERFKDYYRKTFLQGSREFILDNGASGYMLADVDMELRAAGLPVDFGDVEVADAVVLDSVSSPVSEVAETPFRLDFLMDGAIWVADLFASTKDQAWAKLKAMEESGRIWRAVDFVKGIGGEPALDSAEYDHPLFIDLKSRRVCELGAVLRG